MHFLNYLKGVQVETEEHDLQKAKRHFIDSLIGSEFINHRIRKLTLLRLVEINR